MQRNPVSPHKQVSVFDAAEPSVVSQGTGVQVLVAATHKRPESAVHPVPPHKQASVFGVAPLVCVQSGAVMHRQKSEFMSQLWFTS